jgi:hypothetical protein
MLLGDNSLRFYKYILRLSNKIGGVINIKHKSLKLHNSIIQKCYEDVQYDDQLERRDIRSPEIDDLPQNVLDTYPRRILMPIRKNSKTIEKRIMELYNDKNIDLIVFPILCIQRDVDCDNKDNKRHISILVYNKVRKELEFWDDRYPKLQVRFGLYRLYRTLAPGYLIPILRDYFGFEFGNETVHRPVLTERYYGKVKKELEDKYYDNSFPYMHNAFLVEYIHNRIDNSDKEQNSLSKNISNKMMERYEEYMKYNKEWKEKTKCDHPMKIVNPETNRCINIKSAKGKEVLGIDETCPFPALRNVATSRCKEINVNQKFVEADDDNYLKDHVWNRWAPLMAYFLKKHPYLGTSDDNIFYWNPLLKKDGTIEWKFRKPASFDNLMKEAMTNDKITHIVFFLTLTSNAKPPGRHLNPLIIDKAARTIERFESNEPAVWKKYNNGKPLNTAIIDTFKEYGLDYIPPLTVCPIGFQAREGSEDSLGIKGFANCAIWSLWYMDLRLTNPAIPRDELVKGAYLILKKEGAFLHFINSYHAHLLKETNVNKKKIIKKLK